MAWIDIIKQAIFFFVFIWFARLMLALIDAVIYRDIFTVRNVRRLVYMGHIALMIPFIWLLFDFALDYALKEMAVLPTGASYAYTADWFEGILSSLDYYLFAGILKYGYTLKQEVDLTI